jgi:hypothetical protein
MAAKAYASDMEPNPYFGDLEGVPATEGARRVPAPVGELCLWCEEPVREGDMGWLMWSLGEDGAVRVPVHAECSLRQVVGGLNCVTGRHTCRGGRETEADPPHLSRREAALAVWAWVHEHGV